MKKINQSELSILTDNWQLQSALKGLNGEFELTKVNDCIVALLQLLDLIIISDNIFYQPNKSWIWADGKLAPELSKLLTPLDLNEDLEDAISKEVTNKMPEGLEHLEYITQHGALYYSELSNLLGISYYPSSARSKYLYNHHFKSINQNAGFLVNKIISDESINIIEQVFNKFDYKAPTLFYGFGISILLKAENINEILSIAFDMKNSREVKGFREWLLELDAAFDSGNLKTIAKAYKSIHNVISSIHNDIGITNNDSNGIELQLGISPSVKLNSNSISSFLQYFTPKPFYVTFLRKHFESIINLDKLIRAKHKLFPALL